MENKQICHSIININSKYMINALDKNIGNGRIQYFDGFSTPIGGVGDPYFNQKYFEDEPPFFLQDKEKAKYSNYLEYIEKTRIVDNLKFIRDIEYGELRRDIDTPIGICGSYYLTRQFRDIKNITKIIGKELTKKDKDYLQDLGNIELLKKSYCHRITANVDGVYINNDLKIGFVNPGNKNMYEHSLCTYAEEGDNKIKNGTYNEGAAYGNYTVYSSNEIQNCNDLINKTNEGFKNLQFDTLIARFHLMGVDEDLTNSAVSKGFGMSRGRNLLTKEAFNKTGVSATNGYSNPYCRVWTFHHQYNKLSDTIRPFAFTNEKNNEIELIDYKNTQIDKYRTENGTNLLEEYGVKGANRLVRIAPTTDKNIKHCMFSIENLAWKDEPQIIGGKMIRKDGELGPNGGRIMWFPPYDITFSENTSVNWGENQFIGRGEKIYTYADTERSGNLSFKLLIDYPSILNQYKQQKNLNTADGDEEQQILRFFAGCDILEKQNTQTEKENIKKIQKHLNYLKNLRTKKIIFNVYFPNNYSGADDRDGDGKFAVTYLRYGSGAGYWAKDEKLDNGKKGCLDFTFSSMTTREIKDDKKHRNGYEISDKKDKGGISWISSEKEDYLLGQDGYRCVSVSREKDTRMDVYACQYATTSNWWGYRIDNAYSGESLSSKSNYSDTKSFGLNAKVSDDTQNQDENTKLYSFKDVYDDIEGEDESAYIKQILNKIHQVTINGYASSHGTGDNNKKLAQDRAETIKKWLQTHITQRECSWITGTTSVEKVSGQDINGESAKKSRRVEVVIEYRNGIVYNQEETSASNPNEYGLNDKNKKPLDKTPESDVLDNKIKNTEKDLNQAIKELNHTTAKMNEYEFFEELKLNQPFLHNKIIDKIKYFDPAYHSITPEGFQSRLTFLNQCTRQGNTSKGSAQNLAFGRPPVCVLRIGDFYNTRIVINSLNIQYDDTTWDLNDEGAGVMPMMAKIDLTFKFLGGSDLTGPISMLQNAISFNYYANSSVIDDRAKRNDNNNS